MRERSVIGIGLAGVVAAALTLSSIGIVLAGATRAAAAGVPLCTDGALTAHGPTDNGDGTTSVVLLGTADTATVTITIPANVRRAHLDVCGAQGTAASSG